MKTIKSLKDITILEVSDKVVFGNLICRVARSPLSNEFYLSISNHNNDKIFEILNIDKIKFIKELGVAARFDCDFPETKSLEALTAIVSALFKEYEKQNELPKTWEEFCKRNPVRDEERYINSYSKIEKTCIRDDKRDEIFDRNFCTSKQEAKAFLALMQLRQLRKCYVGNWEPDYDKDKENIFTIHWAYKNGFIISVGSIISRTLSFPNYELARQFLTNFKDLLEIAKPLL